MLKKISLMSLPTSDGRLECSLRSLRRSQVWYLRIPVKRYFGRHPTFLTVTSTWFNEMGMSKISSPFFQSNATPPKQPLASAATPSKSLNFFLIVSISSELCLVSVRNTKLGECLRKKVRSLLTTSGSPSL